MRIANTVWVVTGAGGGIGGELVLQLLHGGAQVAAVDLRPEGLDELREKAGDVGTKLSLHPLDISDKAAVAKLPAEVIKQHGAVDGLLNCAGIIQPFVRVNDLDYDTIDRVMNVNFFGTLFMTKAFLPHLLKRKEAHLVNVSSMGGFLPVPGQSVYGASKAAVKLLTEGLYAELLDTPVHVTLVFPGSTNTNISQNSHVSLPASAKIDTAKLQANVLPANVAATQIIAGIIKNKPQVFTGRDSKLMNTLYRLSPVRATKLITKQMKSLLG